MKRSAPMKRTPFRAKGSDLSGAGRTVQAPQRERHRDDTGPDCDRRSGHPSAKPAKDRTCICGATFTPRRMEHVVCSPKCLVAKKKADAKAERASLKARKEKLKTRRDRIAEAQAAVNKYSRLRDLRAGRGCVSCGSRPDPRFGGSMDAGHFRSVGSAPHLRFLTSQIRLQCVKCNRYLSGNVVEYRKALVAERGSAWVEWLESLQDVAKWDEDYLIRLKRLANKKTRRLEKRHAMQG